MIVSRARLKLCGALLVFLLCTSVALYATSRDAAQRYEQVLSTIIYDRHGVPMSVAQNSKGHYVLPVKELPDDFKRLLIRKEDRFFFYHLGVNPISTLRAVMYTIIGKRTGGASTMTQQLAKNILSTETHRSLRHKALEAWYALSMELFMSKDAILSWYVNSVYLGNQVQGFNTASYAYFNKPLEDTTHSEKIALLATLSYPSTRNPWKEDNARFAQSLNERIAPHEKYYAPETTTNYAFQTLSNFELSTANVTCTKSCATTIDSALTEKLRDILARHITQGWDQNVRNGAIVVINPHTEELIAMVGSKNPSSDAHGNQINMALAPRPIGSTIKPFIYGKGFELGLRPYTQVEDREYKYPIATNFPLYPKNYDGQYRGTVTLHEALSNSLNVPTVKVLEYIGLSAFYTFLSDTLAFHPLQDYDQYQYGIALGGLEMDLTTLTHYFTTFPRKGTIAPLRVLAGSSENFNLPLQSSVTEPHTVFSPAYTELVHTILSDRYSGANQFGIKGNLNLPIESYGVKTGTSRDYHDSWTVGYTNDFVVGVWIGDSENKPLKAVSGSTGAGALWHDVMQYLLTTSYNTNTTIALTHPVRIQLGKTDEWGLTGDDVDTHRTMLSDDNLILSIHEGDTFELSETSRIPLRARKDVTWTINGTSYGTSRETAFSPRTTGTHEIAAYDETANVREIIHIKVIASE